MANSALKVLRNGRSAAASFALSTALTNSLAPSLAVGAFLTRRTAVPGTAAPQLTSAVLAAPFEAFAGVEVERQPSERFGVPRDPRFLKPFADEVGGD